ncbi:MAG: GHKL domain-containing protein [Bacteroidales bacterium]|jgi:nitrogen fixation/metabolism regulation signal transduction histidine kinase|nr:GHKL domain-containing protein [Bacteroidales bacterium]
MFKSIEYKLLLYIGLLIVAVAAATYFMMEKQYIGGGLAIFVTFIALNNMYKHYKKFNTNILFLLNALDNGDYTFHFAETKMSRRERELNRMMNRIKDILADARKEVIANEKFLSLVVESVSTGIFIFDGRGIVHRTNNAALQILGLPIFTHLNQLQHIHETFTALFANLPAGSSIQIQIANEREEKQVNVHVSEIRTAGAIHKIVTLHNIGSEMESKEMESWIRLIRVMTHEIMNSIAPISSLSETMLSLYMQEADCDEDLLRDNTTEAFQTIHATAKGLLHFVDSYRKFTGIPKPQMSRIELLPLIDEAISLESAEIEHSNISIKILDTTQNVVATKTTSPQDGEVTINADKSQVMQVLVNLLKNAIEAVTPDIQQAEIRITVKQRKNAVCIEVADNGLPIPPEVLPNIFIPFFTTKEAGSGIGLSISRYIMRLHGGNLRHHTENGWTVFSMEFL